jgi:hypothetical protein
MRIQNGLPCTKSKFGQIWRRERGRDSECLAWARRQQKAAAKSARFGVHFTQIITIRVKWPAKPDPVKRRLSTIRRFYLTELAVPLDLYIRHIPRPRQRC